MTFDPAGPSKQGRLPGHGVFPLNLLLWQQSLWLSASGAMGNVKPAAFCVILKSFSHETTSATPASAPQKKRFINFK